MGQCLDNSDFCPINLAFLRYFDVEHYVHNNLPIFCYSDDTVKKFTEETSLQYCGIRLYHGFISWQSH